jgi:hypothetical protein
MTGAPAETGTKHLPKIILDRIARPICPVAQGSTKDEVAEYKQPGTLGGWVVAVCLLLVCCLDYSSILKKDAVYSSETSVQFCHAKMHYIPEYTPLHIHHCDNLKSL